MTCDFVFFSSNSDQAFLYHGYDQVTALGKYLAPGQAPGAVSDR